MASSRGFAWHERGPARCAILRRKALAWLEPPALLLLTPTRKTSHMSLKAKLTEDLKTAMRAKDSVRLDAIRSIRAAVTLREADSQQELDDAAIAEIVRGLRKQRVESIEQYEQGGRAELAEKERLEKAILEQYLPAGPDASTVESTVRAVISELAASSPKDMGRVIQTSKGRLVGVDGKELSEVVKRLLSGG